MLRFLIIILIFIIIFYPFEILTLVNSHFGSNLTNAESDNKEKSKNYISQLYDNYIKERFKELKQKPRIKTKKIPKIHVSKLSPSLFIKLTRNFTNPLIIRGFSKKNGAFQKWNLNYFRERYGKTVLPYIPNASLENNSKYLENNYSDYKYININDFITKLEKGEKVYINNISRIFGYHPELLGDLPRKQISYYTGQDLIGGKNVTHIFFGSQDTGTTLHCSYTGNFFYNIRGKKQWYLIHPKFSKYLLPINSNSGLFSVSKVDIFNPKKNDMIHKFPRYEFILEEGDLLFNPPWWWHAVKNITPYTIGCANRFSRLDVGLSNNFLYTLTMLSHPIKNSKFLSGNKSLSQHNIDFDKHLLQDILKKDKKVN